MCLLSPRERGIKGVCHPDRQGQSICCLMSQFKVSARSNLNLGSAGLEGLGVKATSQPETHSKGGFRWTPMLIGPMHVALLGQVRQICRMGDTWRYGCACQVDFHGSFRSGEWRPL